MIITELIDVFKEYRNGNQDVFNILYTDKVQYKRYIYNEGHFVIVDESVAKVVNNTYKLFKKHGAYNNQGKYFEQVYVGTRDDFSKDAIIILLEIFRDKDVDFNSSKEICELLKYKLKKYVNNVIGVSVYSISDIYTDDEGGECSYFKFVGQMPDFDYSENNEGYIGEIKELMDMLKHYNIKEFCSPNATVQKEIIDLINSKYKYRYYSENDCCDLPKDIEMISFYQLKYRKEISQQQYSAVLDELFKVLCDCTSTLKGLNVTRKQYNNTKQRSDIYIVHRLTTRQVNSMIVLANQLIKYVPKVVKNDKYFDIISKNAIFEICNKNKALKRNIVNKSQLQLDEYTDTLNAIGYMLLDYCKDKIIYYYNSFIQKYGKYEFDADNVLDVILGKEAEQKFTLWSLKYKSDGFHLLGFKNKNNDVVAFNGSCGDIKLHGFCVQIGNAKLFVSDSDKKVYCRSADKELFYIKEVKHKYKNFSRIA